MKELVEKIAALVADFNKDANAQIENGNKAAGTRARKASLEIEKAMKEFRKVSLEESKKLAVYEEMQKPVHVRTGFFFFNKACFKAIASNTHRIPLLAFFLWG